MQHIAEQLTEDLKAEYLAEEKDLVGVARNTDRVLRAAGRVLDREQGSSTPKDPRVFFDPHES